VQVKPLEPHQPQIKERSELMSPEKKQTLKQLYEQRNEIGAMIAQKRADFESSMEPFWAQAEDLDVRMNNLLGEEHVWIEGKFDDDGLPVIIDAKEADKPSSSILRGAKLLDDLYGSKR